MHVKLCLSSSVSIICCYDSNLKIQYILVAEIEKVWITRQDRVQVQFDQ